MRGKNSGDVDGESYFTTSIPGAGIFVPLAKALRRDSPPNSVSTTYPLTPTTSSFGGLRAGTQNSTNHAPPTPSLPKFSQSIGPGAAPPRAPSPQTRRTRPSLPRPESPIRRLAMTPGPRPSYGSTTPAPRVPSRYGTPPPNRFAQSVRGTAGDPSKRTLERQASIGPRSASALGQASNFGGDDDVVSTSMQPPPAKTNGSIGSMSSFNSKFRPASRANNDEEVERLRGQLEDRERQLREQSATLGEMESSLTELQALMENPETLRPRRNSLDDKDSMQLRAIIREKNEKITMLTAEFDAHRADFRSTIDTLEMASTETERVYEKRIEELQQEIRELESRIEDVDTVARQFAQLEELVQELEEGLEESRRSEAEARGEVEFLRGEVERTRAELRREREKASGGGGGAGGPKEGNEGTASSKELEQKEDEIRGLKAIIHSLSRDSVPGGGDGEAAERSHPGRSGSFVQTHSATDAQAIREKMEREMAELRVMLDDKSHREEELERELEVLRRASMTREAGAQRSSLRDSRDTVVLSRRRDSRSSPEETLKRGSTQTLDPMVESDAYSTATENSTLWCEICETAGHDVLSCTQMFGDGANSSSNNGAATATAASARALSTSTAGQQQHLGSVSDDVKPAPLSPAKTKTPLATPTVSAAPNPLDSGPVAGKASGVVDDSKWCALCERDGHDSVDCPFEDAF
ncbi:hypothetical protein ACRALDRAFT_1074510 [Sodiomyces alcalophilus JCM 7366]|uniref:uncharacterized protein n=1 Tax=Sodiomyces alcalophilus JCM 7366 TaxID=591952 RepID=UPI0039B3E1B2